MTQLDDFTREALCAGDQPPPGVEDRILAAIVGPLGGPGPDGGGAGGASQAPPPGSGVAATIGETTLSYAAKVVAATLGLAAGGVALIAVSAAGVRSIGEAGRSEAKVEIAAAPEPTTVAALAPAQPEAQPPEELATKLEEPPSPAAALARPRTRKPVTKPAVDEGIEAELALMKLARESKDPQAALRALEQHRERFEDGALAAEREVLRVEQLCALGRRGEAQAVTKRFVAKYPSNPLRSRVESACAKN